MRSAVDFERQVRQKEKRRKEKKREGEGGEGEGREDEESGLRVAAVCAWPALNWD